MSQFVKSVFVSFVLGVVWIGQAAAQKAVPVTPPTGESWISHLRRALADTSMGKTGLLGPATLVPEPVTARQSTTKARRPVFGAVKESVAVQGADLYRMNCRACHGEFGLGAPPEINSVIDAARATYAPFTRERLRRLGMETSRTQANELAHQAKGALLERLHTGGVDMPSFPQLSDQEARAIFGYLRQLAEIPGAAQQQVRIEEPSVRVGEHIVKSTCHICHSAVGVNPSPEELMQGEIPPLSALTSRVSLPGFERKVRHGAPIMMGTPLLPYRGRMPVFEYLSESEVADAYLYLKLFPPTGSTDPVTPPQPQVQLASVAPDAVLEPPSNPPPAEVPAARQADARKSEVISAAAAVIVALLIVGGIVFTVYDVKRSKPKALRSGGIGVRRLAISPGEPSGKAKRLPLDPHKQAAWRSRFHRTEHDVFESSWFSRQLKNKDGAA